MKSDPVRWHRLKDILVEALKETSFEKRRATLRESCGDDAELLGEAEKLLAHDATAFEEFAELAATRLRDDERNRTGERIGAYVVVSELGRGGMGAVYLAQRADGQFEKRVAVKVTLATYSLTTATSSRRCCMNSGRRSRITSPRSRTQPCARWLI